MFGIFEQNIAQRQRREVKMVDRVAATRLVRNHIALVASRSDQRTEQGQHALVPAAVDDQLKLGIGRRAVQHAQPARAIADPHSHHARCIGLPEADIGARLDHFSDRKRVEIDPVNRMVRIECGLQDKQHPIARRIDIGEIIAVNPLLFAADNPRLSGRKIIDDQLRRADIIGTADRHLARDADQDPLIARPAEKIKLGLFGKTDPRDLAARQIHHRQPVAAIAEIAANDMRAIGRKLRRAQAWKFGKDRSGDARRRDFGGRRRLGVAGRGEA